MFFLVTGASGVGKSTVRKIISEEFGNSITCAELAHLGLIPEWSLSWRQRAVERAVQIALEAQNAGRHFLLCGDPIPPGEVYAAPSAPRLAAISTCLLDASPEAQQARLLSRGDDPNLTPHHLAFAAWMRGHAKDHLDRPEVIIHNGWDQMQWDRWTKLPPGNPPWACEIIDTSSLSPQDVAEMVAGWIRNGIRHHLASNLTTL